MVDGRSAGAIVHSLDAHGFTVLGMDVCGTLLATIGASRPGRCVI